MLFAMEPKFWTEWWYAGTSSLSTTAFVSSPTASTQDILKESQTYYVHRMLIVFSVKMELARSMQMSGICIGRVVFVRMCT